MEAKTPARHLVDEHGRTVRYLRLSVTDRCNLRCLYCRSSAKERNIPHDQVLRYEEMLPLVRAAVDFGVEKIRLTGGEPFARKGFLRLVGMLRAAFPSMDIRITSNGTLVRPYVAALRDLGVSAINISLDSFRRKGFEAVTGKDLLPEVLRTLDTLLAAGIRVKINAVALRGVNDDELHTFLDFAAAHPVDVRFIEFMPMGSATRWSIANFWPADEVLEQAQRLARLIPVTEQGLYSGPARMFTLEGGQGRFGLITPLSNHFCATCNRLRLTADGNLRTCLFADREYRLRNLLRHPALGLPAVRRVMEMANRRKPLGVHLLRARTLTSVASKAMVGIGG